MDVPEHSGSRAQGQWSDLTSQTRGVISSSDLSQVMDRM